MLFRAKNGDLLQRYQALFSNDEDRRLYGELMASRKEYIDVEDEVLRASRIGTPESTRQALEILQTKLKPAGEKYSANYRATK